MKLHGLEAYGIFQFRVSWSETLYRPNLIGTGTRVNSIMLISIIITAVIGLIGIFLHRRTRLEEKVFKNIPLSEWLTVLIFPLCFYVCWVIFVRNIINRPLVPLIPMDDFDILAMMMFFLIYAFVGNAIHFTGKILWRYLRHDSTSMAYRTNEMFHGKLSHYIIYFDSLIALFLFPVLEVNHPLEDPLSEAYILAIIAAGIVFGVSSTKAIFYTNEWFGGYNKPLFFLTFTILTILVSFSKVLKLQYQYYPIKLFMTAVFGSIVAAFIVRQVLIYTRLNRRARLRFLVKILSA